MWTVVRLREGIVDGYERQLRDARTVIRISTQPQEWMIVEGQGTQDKGLDE